VAPLIYGVQIGQDDDTRKSKTHKVTLKCTRIGLQKIQNDTMSEQE